MSGLLKGSRFFIRTFGCQMNENDSEHLAGLLREAGAEPAGTLEASDIVVVNTCAVRRKSEEKASSFLGRLRGLKERNAAVVVAAGCTAQLRGAELLGPRSPVDIVVGPGSYLELPELVAGRARGLVATGRRRAWRELPPGTTLREDAASAYVTVMEGCDNFCSYCVVPFARGRERCRPARLVLAEVEESVRDGYLEVQLLGQNVNSYRDPETGAGFAEVLDRVARVPGIEWVRFLTSHPRDLTPAVARVMADRPSVCRQIHLPLQSGSTPVLARMNRGYAREDYMERIALLRGLMPGIALSTDIIVGFPGETEADFERTLAALEEVRFANIFSFRYSPRPRTAAARLPDDVPPETKQRRLVELQALQKRIQLEGHRALVGTTLLVLVTGPSRRGAGRVSGRAEGGHVVNFDAPGAAPGRFVRVRVTGAGPYSLVGEAAG